MPKIYITTVFITTMVAAAGTAHADPTPAPPPIVPTPGGSWLPGNQATAGRSAVPVMFSTFSASLRMPNAEITSITPRMISRQGTSPNAERTAARTCPLADKKSECTAGPQGKGLVLPARENLPGNRHRSDCR
jgi:hypothetical protein